MKKNKEAIFKTIIYADIFDYPLTAEEIKRFLIKTSNRHSGLSRIRFWSRFTPQNDGMLKQVQHDGEIETDGKYFFLKNRKKIVELRKKRKKWSREKLERAKRAASFLKLIPWVKMVGITGSLAMSNSGKEDDIDFLIVSRTHRLWLTRLLATVLMEISGMRRHPGVCHPERAERVEGSRPKAARASLDSSPAESAELGMTPSYKDKICLNMYLDEDHLQVPKKEQDLFAAHEVVQARLLWDKDGIYNKFLLENLWVKKYLPNAVSVIPSEVDGPSERSERASLDFSPRDKLGVRNDNLRIFNLLESLAKSFQLWYMRSRRTTEVISDGIIRFHPRDVRKWVLTRYQDSLRIALIKKE